MAVPKLSKMQQRIAGRTGPAGTGIVTGLAVKVVEKKKSSGPSLREVPDHPYIAYMSRSNCECYDHKNNVVISISNPELPDAYRPEFTQAIDRLYLAFNPTSNHDNWIQTEHKVKITEFLEKHAGKNIVVHCGEGTIRSPSLAMGIKQAINEAYSSHVGANARTIIELYRLYHFVGARWVQKTDNEAYEDCYIDGRVQHVGYRSVKHNSAAWIGFFETQGATTI